MMGRRWRDVIGATVLAGAATAQAGAVSIAAWALLPDCKASHYSRFVNFRPADAAAVRLNPPRFSWRYGANAWAGGSHAFTFQIADNPDFANPHFSVKTRYNFYNTIPALPAGKRWHWRVGYDVGTDHEVWGRPRTFTIDPQAVAWDRSALAAPDLARRGHPRILFNPSNLEAIRALQRTHPVSRRVAGDMKQQALRIIKRDWWAKFPPSDRKKAAAPFLKIAHDLALVAFVWRVVDPNPAFAGVKERALTLASYPKGGRASPEGAGGESHEDSTQINEFLALLFDWLYPVLTGQEQRVFVQSLEWRADYWINSFAWRRKGQVRGGSLSTVCSSHAYEGSMDTAPIGLALYEHSPMGKTCFDLMLNYLIGITNGFGFDEAWNEGPGYGTSKMKWLLNATVYYDTALPKAHLGRNPCYRAVGDFFARITPVGLPHSPWGNGSANAGYYTSGRRANFRRLAYLTGEGRFLRNWRESGGKHYAKWRPWIEYVLPHHYREPKEALEADPVKLFPISGWVTAASEPPSSAAAFKDSVGIIFQCRPRGGYSHSFNSDGSLQMHAYGQQINHGGGSTVNKDAYAYHAMSHTTVLVDGLGPAQRQGLVRPFYGRIAAFQRLPQAIYFAGDTTWAYPDRPGKYSRWGLPMHKVYERRGLGHLRRALRHVLFMRQRYVVVFDDLRTAPDRPSRFTWLYHVLPAKPFHLDPKAGRATYEVNKTPVIVQHVAHRAQLSWQDRRGLDGMVNPLTGEDYRRWRKKGPQPAHNLWVTSAKPASRFHFLAVVYPYRPGRPEPVVEPVDDRTVRVVTDPETTDVIHFGSAPPAGATLVVDCETIGQGADRVRSSHAATP